MITEKSSDESKLFIKRLSEVLVNLKELSFFDSSKLFPSNYDFKCLYYNNISIDINRLYFIFNYKDNKVYITKSTRNIKEEEMLIYTFNHKRFRNNKTIQKIIVKSQLRVSNIDNLIKEFTINKTIRMDIKDKINKTINFFLVKNELDNFNWFRKTITPIPVIFINKDQKYYNEYLLKFYSDLKPGESIVFNSIEIRKRDNFFKNMQSFIDSKEITTEYAEKLHQLILKLKIEQM